MSINAQRVEIVCFGNTAKVISENLEQLVGIYLRITSLTML